MVVWKLILVTENEARHQQEICIMELLLNSAWYDADDDRAARNYPHHIVIWWRSWVKEENDFFSSAMMKK